jgi:DHA1 family bicyclomycin/chloramphenicol resistance-like MFS transporter
MTDTLQAAMPQRADAEQTDGKPNALGDRPIPPLWLLALITFSGTLAMHIFVPVLPLAGQSLNANPAQMQLTISFYILGLACGQLFYGPLSDRHGRRPVLLAGLAVYLVASVIALASPDIHTLLGARLLQALGGCAGMVIGRAVVRDTSTTEEATRRLALMNLMVTIGPGFAPVLGAILGDIAGWRSIFVFLCLLGLANSLLTWKLLPETARKTADQTAGLVLKNYLNLLRTPAFLGYAIGGSCATTSFYAFVSAAPFIFGTQLNRPSHEIGIYLGILILGYWLGSLIASRLAGRVSVPKLLRSNILSLAAALYLLVTAMTGHLTVITVMLPMFIYTIGGGIASPAALAEAISVNPRVAGSASGLYGFFQMAVGAIATALAGLGEDHTLTASSVVVVACLLSQVCFAVANRAARRQADYISS